MQLAYVAIFLIGQAFEEVPKKDAFPAPGYYRHKHDLAEKYDPVDDATSVHLGMYGLTTKNGNQVSVNLTHLNQGRERKPSGAWLSIRSRVGASKGWQFLKYHDIRILVDETRVKSDGSYDGEIDQEDNLLVESVGMHLTDQQLINFA